MNLMQFTVHFLGFGIVTFLLHEFSHWFWANIFGFNPVFYYNKKKLYKYIPSSVWSMSWIASKETPVWKLITVIISGPLVELSFIFVGIYLQWPILIFVNVCMLIGAWYDFTRLYDLIKYRHDYRQFGYCGV